MVNNRRRGRLAETEAARVIEAAISKKAHVISRPMNEDIEGGDIMVELGGQVRPIIQVKRKSGQRPMWIDQALSNDGLGIIRWDRAKWVLVIELP